MGQVETEGDGMSVGDNNNLRMYVNVSPYRVYLMKENCPPVVQYGYSRDNKILTYF